HKDVPGRPAMYATTRKFLDYFNLKNLDDLPTLAEIRDLDSLNAELALEGADTPPVDATDGTELAAEAAVAAAEASPVAEEPEGAAIAAAALPVGDAVADSESEQAPEASNEDITAGQAAEMAPPADADEEQGL